MSQFKNISEYNDYLSDRLTNYKINEYFKKIHELFNKDVDITFMEYFLSLIENKNEFCVEQCKLIEYGIIKERKDNTNIKNCIENKKYNFIENIDYVVLTPERSGVKREGRGGSNGNAKNYAMKPHVFKMCLMRSKNTNTYAKYYLELEECFYYYNEYQIKYQKVLLSGKDTKIDELLKDNKEQSKKMDEQSKIMKEQSEEIKELLKYAKNAKVSLDEANESIDEMKEDIENLNDKVEEVRDEFRENLEHINPPPSNETNLHMFALLQYKNETNNLMIIRGQNKHLSKKITEEMNVVIDKTYNPNPIDLFILVRNKVREVNKKEKEAIKESYKKNVISLSEKNRQLKDNKEHPAIRIKYNSIFLNFNKITLNEFIDLINKCDNVKRETYIP